MTKRGYRAAGCKTMSSTKPMVFLFLRHAMFARPYVCLSCKAPVLRLPTRPQTQYFHVSPPLARPRRKDFFSSNAHLKQKQNNTDEPIEFPADSQKQRRRGPRLPAAPTSLRRVAVEAQRSKDGILSKALLKEQGLYRTKVGITEIFYNFLPLIILVSLDSDRLRRSRAIQHPPS